MREGWRRVRLDEAGTSVGVVVQPNAGDVRPYIALENIAQGAPTLLGHGRAGSAASAKTEFRCGDILYGKLRPNLRKVVRAPFDGVCSTDVIAIRARPGVEPMFLLHLLHTEPFTDYAVQTASGTKMPRTSWGAISKFEFHLPPLDEQRRIAAVLSSIDAAVERQETVVAAADRLLTSLLHEIVGARLSSSGYPTAVVADLAAFSGGNGFTPRDWTQTGLPIIRIQNLNGSQNFNYYGGEPEADWVVEPGELLFAWAGSRGSSFGPCIWPGPRGVLNQHIHRLTPRPVTAKQFLYWLLRFITAEIEKRAHGFKDSLVHLRKGELTGWPVRVPPLAIQEEMARILDNAAAVQDAEKLVALRLRAAKSAAATALLSGEAS